MDKQRTENMASDNTQQNIKDVRSSKISEEDTGRTLLQEELHESKLNEQHQQTNKQSQKNAATTMQNTAMPPMHKEVACPKINNLKMHMCRKVE